jgi:methyl coenzyme M reductase alpha subunit
MNKILNLTLISAIALVLSAGCASKEMGAHVDATDEATVKSAIYIGHLKNEKAIDAIKKAAEKTGWRVTEFKSNAVIVEKVVDGETISRTIKVYNRHISGDEEASGSELKELRQAIVEELKEQKKSSSH